MNIRVKVEYEQEQKARYAYASDEHAASSYGRPVIVLAGEALGCAELDGTVVTADRELAVKLTAAGYSVRISRPQAKWDRDNIKPISVRLTTAEREALQSYAVAHDLTVHAAIKQLIRDATAKEAGTCR